MTPSEIATLCLARIGAEGLDTLILQFVDEASELILNYINRTSMPNGCKMVWVAIACDMYKHSMTDFGDNASTFELDGFALNAVSTVKIDDAEVSDGITPAQIAANASRQSKELDFLKDYRQRLQPFRLMRWTPID